MVVVNLEEAAAADLEANSVEAEAVVADMEEEVDMGVDMEEEVAMGVDMEEAVAVMVVAVVPSIL